MNLLSVMFALYLAVLLVAYFGAAAVAPRWQWVVLLVANATFYWLAGGARWLWLIVLMALVSWVASQGFGRLTAKAKEERKATRDRAERKLIKQRLVTRKRVVLWSAIAAMLAVLGYFKYWNVILFNLHIADSPTSLGIVLPLGISFYTFMSLSYVIDTYNDKYEPEPNFWRYLTFVSYFPQFLQGPINHYDQMRGQLSEAHRPSWDGMRRGALRFGLGLVKKVAIANMVAGSMGAVLAAISPSMSGAVALWGMVLYSIYMYGDFSGGIDMVEGISELLGIEMAQNFRQPYLSTSLADFWRRWHMSLGVIMRDCCFYPLAVTKFMQNLGRWAKKHLGTHAGRTLPACIANIAVFLLVGFWHGAEWHFIAWGLFNGLVIAASDLLAPVYARMREALPRKGESLAFRLFAIVRTFLLVSVIRTFDAIASVRLGVTALTDIFLHFVPQVPFVDELAATGMSLPNLLGIAPVVLVGFALVMVIDVFEERGTDVRAAILSWGYVPRLALYLFCALLVASALPQTITGGVSFMYAGL